jgi:hypothetical protein
MDLENVWYWMVALFVGTYVVTLLFEWPFVMWCLRGTSDWFRRSIGLNLIVQTISYSMLALWYWLASPVSLITQTHLVQPSEIDSPIGAQVYYIGTDDNAAYVRDLRGGPARKVADMNFDKFHDLLYARKNADRPETWDLVASLPDKGIEVHPREVTTRLSGKTAPELFLDDKNPASFQQRQERPAIIPSPGQSQWKYGAGYWAAEGFRIKNLQNGKSKSFAFETPFGAWRVRSIIQFGDKALFQLGGDQICLFDPETRKIALITRGRSPLLVLEK